MGALACPSESNFFGSSGKRVLPVLFTQRIDDVPTSFPRKPQRHSREKGGNPVQAPIAIKISPPGIVLLYPSCLPGSPPFLKLFRHARLPLPDEPLFPLFARNFFHFQMFYREKGNSLSAVHRMKRRSIEMNSGAEIAKG